ncbi:MAG: 5-(carboxyamino)imidazole ribonucleotide mutase [Spirochaetales bacterium]
MKQNSASPMVGIIMGSDSDLPVMKEAAEVLDQAKVPYEITIVSAHRTPLRMVRYAQEAEERGIQVIIAGAGGAAHLPGMTASLTPLPVVGVPIRTTSFSGLDSLLSIVQMPNGVPVATVAVNAAKNAALLAIRILALTNPPYRDWLNTFIETQQATVETKARKLEEGALNHE